MARHAEDLYGDEGSVPKQIPMQGSGAGPMSVRANPEDFGAQIGQGEQKVGEAAQGLATQYGGMVNETLMTNADSALAQKIGQIKGAYLQNTGLAAAAAFPKYQADLEAARQEARANLPLGAQHGFDMLATRSIANHEADGSTYAAGQTRQALVDSGTNLQNVNVQAVLDPDIAKDPARVQWHQDSAIHGLQMTLDENHPGLKTDPETGTINFDESNPEGRSLKANYEARVNDIITQTQTNRFNALAKGDVLGAFGIYKQERDSLPKPTQVQLDAMFEPRVFNAHVQNGSSSVLVNANQDYARTLYNPSNAGSNANNLGNVKTSQGAANNTQDFISPATPVDGAILTANNIRTKNYEGKTLEQIGHTWTSTDKDAWVNNVSTVSGISPDTVPNLDDPATLGKILKGISVAEGKNKALFTDDVIAQGVAGSLSGKQAQTAGATQSQKSYATNPDGSKLTTADYYRTHSEDVLQRADAQSEKDMPGDLQYKRAMRETVTNYMNKVISNQSAQYMLDNKNVVKAINGEFTKGKAPETEAELRAIPGADDLLNRVAAQDPKFAEGIPTMIAKMARRNDVSNSSNGYDTIIRALQPQDEDHPNHIKNQNQLDSLLGKSDGTGINMKDYNDAKPLTDLPKDSPIKEPILKTMQEITNANGNIDGKGQQRALQWYNQTMAAYKKNEALGDKKDPNFAENIGKPEGPVYTPPVPSRITQMENWLKEKTGLGHVTMRNPDGTIGLVPAANVEKAMKLGYQKSE